LPKNYSDQELAGFHGFACLIRMIPADAETMGYWYICNRRANNRVGGISKS
jgi:hypothetical protein